MTRHNVPEFLRNLESALKDAQLSSDVQKLDELVADDLVFVGLDGSILTKSDDLASHASGAVRFRKHETIDIQAHQIASNAWFVVHRTLLTLVVDGSVTSGSYAYSRIWASGSEGVWRVQCGHISAWRAPASA
jgi:ketosteroid isomerase-like protein